MKTKKEVLRAASKDGLITIFEKHIAFCSKAFPKASETSCLHHAVEEICEVWKEGDLQKKKEEYADVVMCLLHGMKKSGITMEDLVGAFVSKLNKNESREWVENADGSYTHIKKINHD